MRRWMRRTAAVTAVALGGGVTPLATGTGWAAGAAPAHVSDPASLVNPFIGTTNGGDTFPGADAPFGMVQWSPDTPSRPAGGGYSYDDSSILGYSLTHLSGPGCSAEGDVPILPTAGAVGATPASQTEPFSHSSEVATPGYYQLTAGGVETQLTTTTRSGLARFTFPSGATTGNLLFKLSGSATPVTGSHFQVVNNKEVDGWITSGQFCGASNSYTMYFDVRFSRPLSSYGSWSTGGTGDYVSFDTSTNSHLEAQVGVSYVSTANAALNRQTEQTGWNLAAARAGAHRQWNQTLGAIQIGGGSPAQQAVFYTALYHSLLHPNTFSDVNGQYIGFDGQVHTVGAGQSAQYANFSGWDIYRSDIQLEAMLDPRQTSDIVTSMLNDYAQSGQFPKWAENNGESYVMVGDPADGIIADAYAFGATNFDTATALKDMETEASVPGNIRPGLSYYENNGYLPADGTYGCCNFYGPVSTQQEYNIADNAIAELARATGHGALANAYAARANNWQNVFNPGTGFVQPKDAAGQFAPGFTPTGSTGFVEADAYVYTAFEPWDLRGLIAAAGGRAKWVSYLDQMTASVTDMGPTHVQMSNEPSFNIPYEYDYAGTPYKAQQVIRQTADALYTDAPGGLAGNDDLGAMSSWYVFSAIGGYPEVPGSGDLAVSSPEFSSVAIHLGNGKTITESAPAAADNAPYVTNLTVNGSSWEKAYLPASLLTRGGTVDWSLSSTPDTAWAAAAGDAPPSDTAGLLPALGYLAGGGDTIVAPGTTTTLDLGVQGMGAGAQSVTWSATTPSGSGLSAGPSSGTIVVRGEGRATEPVALDVPASTPDGRYLVTFSLHNATGTPLPNVVAEIDVARPGDLAPYYNNKGISSDTAPGAADFDGDGFSYSEQALAAAGLSAGKPVTSGGVQYNWPSAAPGTPDNVVAAGQTIQVPAVAGATTLGLIGSATNGPSTGPLTVTYTDGSSQTVTLGFSDWTLGGGGSTPSFGNGTAADTPYRNSVGGTPQTISTYLFTANFPVATGKTIASVTLPNGADQGELHVFALGTDKGALTTS
ncbi:GH92 family glycosyl hydrolase [Acidiferrimicrobium sp. IK]|uniref:GH92 family glycosyl hydrolase n=1 Tax=Acidiferrimicrobium sp. IK TaxID=2871700 RepID=UPI0021CB7CF5|nr:GH92 family glycosyl hydrolase [Acidiferrimicrobium sp. IK]MCU4186718.1 GH92 family glycosyl hydrolase [Acidiferrimicrobium sp. IK]